MGVILRLGKQNNNSIGAGPGVDLVLTLEDGQLFTKRGPQPKLPIFAESETEFFAKAVDAEIEFTKHASGVVTALMLHQGLAARRREALSKRVLCDGSHDQELP